ncbi:MAG: zinc-dependent metalloprotease, partial [FCB group bacterium]|nr:zinc-dependent metalloprotease [FCB group bacterium]
MRLALSILIYLTGFLLFPADIVADEIVVTPDGAEDSSDKSDDKKKKESKLPDFDELIEGYEKIEGLFDLYWKQEENKAFMAIHPDQLGEVFLFSETRQSGDASSFDSGAMLGDYPFRFQRVGDRIQLIHLNTRYRADGETPMSRAMENSISNSIVVSTEIKCKPDSTPTAYLLDLRALFITDEHTLVEYRTGEWKQKYSLDDDNSFFNSLKSFPMNTEIDVSLHYYSSKPHRSTTLPDSRSMLHRYHYSISAIPETDYKPRLADDRLGHFITLFQDYSSVEKDSPYTYYINRWDLRKKDPGATLSEVEKPVVYWLENTIPEKYREACRKGILLWNDAFERIGFKNAIVVKQMPDDADWDPADVRYNTIRWIVQPGGGYAVGPSRANPFTGEIYDADIRISADFVRHFYREHDEWVTPLSVNEIIAQGLDDSHQHKEAGCRYADEKQQQMAFGWNLLTSQELVRPDDLDKFVQDGLIDLVVHEVGHTLGLRHNFKASHIYPLKQLEDKKFTETHGITGSVMDYTPINLSKRENAQGAYFQTVLGFYDHWVMEYAYSQFPEGEKTEKEYLEEIASRSGEALLEYCTDYDARGYSIGGMDPGCSLYDMTSDPLEYYALRVDLVQELWQSLLDLYSLDGARYQKFYQV